MIVSQGDADIFFPTDFLLLERIDHYCSGWLKMKEEQASKPGRKRRTIIVSSILSSGIAFFFFSGFIPSKEKS